jgi:hypothetical protein
MPSSKLSLDYGRHPSAAHRARRALHEFLGDDAAITFTRDAVLLTSELVTNAVTHTERGNGYASKSPTVPLRSHRCIPPRGRFASVGTACTSSSRLPRVGVPPLSPGGRWCGSNSIARCSDRSALRGLSRQLRPASWRSGAFPEAQVQSIRTEATISSRAARSCCETSASRDRRSTASTISVKDSSSITEESRTTLESWESTEHLVAHLAAGVQPHERGSTCGTDDHRDDESHHPPNVRPHPRTASSSLMKRADTATWLTRSLIVAGSASR